VDIRVARIFNTYGPRMHPNDGRVVSNFIVQALKGEDITLYGDGLQTRSFCYVDDLIEGFIRFMHVPWEVDGANQGFPGPINLGNPYEFTIRQLAEMVIKLTGAPSKLVFKQLPSDDPMHRKPDTTRARDVLGWEPRVQLEEGLGHSIRYFENLLTRDR
jgi:UDP-glucuronate decarboxylase